MDHISIKVLMKKVTPDNQPHLDDEVFLGKEKIQNRNFEIYRGLKDCEMIQEEMKASQKGKSWNTIKEALISKLSKAD